MSFRTFYVKKTTFQKQQKERNLTYSYITLKLIRVDSKIKRANISNIYPKHIILWRTDGNLG